MGAGFGTGSFFWQNNLLEMVTKTNLYWLTGTRNALFTHETCEGDARRLFHKMYNGESIVTIRNLSTKKDLQGINPIRWQF